MWENVATQENVEKLKTRGVMFIEPGVGHLASGMSGKGRLAEVDEIIDVIRATLGRGGNLANHKILVTAGGTQEAIDPVRVLANQSSGKMGLALAERARDRGAQVTLIAGVTSQRIPRGMEVVNASSAIAMRDAVMNLISDADALIMAAAVADFRPAKSSEHKIKKGKEDKIVAELVKNPDVLQEVSHALVRRTVLVGFAAETQELIANARAKLEAKNLDLIVANPVPQSFGTDMVQATLITRGGVVTELLPMLKEDLAEKILDFVAEKIIT